MTHDVREMNRRMTAIRENVMYAVLILAAIMVILSSASNIANVAKVDGLIDQLEDTRTALRDIDGGLSAVDLIGVEEI